MILFNVLRDVDIEVQVFVISVYEGRHHYGNENNLPACVLRPDRKV